MTVLNQLARSSRHGPTVPRSLFPHLSLCVPSDPQSRGLEIPLGDLAIRRGQGRRGNGWSDDSEQRGQWRELCETQKEPVHSYTGSFLIIIEVLHSHRSRPALIPKTYLKNLGCVLCRGHQMLLSLLFLPLRRFRSKRSYLFAAP